MTHFPARTACMLALFFVFCHHLLAHNGKVGHAYPLPKIAVDGNLSDWPSTSVKYIINSQLSETKALNDADYNGYFQIGHRLDERALYIAFTITDDSFMEDSSQNVRWNTQDGLELYLDARHLPVGSGVASFMYTKNLRNTNNAFYDPFAKTASWDIMEVAMVKNGSTRIYEWKIKLGDQLVLGKSIGLDFFVFDKDPDGSFSFCSWGKGESKYINPKALSDVILLPENQKLATIEGNVTWQTKINAPLPAQITIRNLKDTKLWLQTEVDSTGRYSVNVPAGKYEIVLPSTYIMNGEELFSISQKQPQKFTVRGAQNTRLPEIVIEGKIAPHLVPVKGVMHDFNNETAKQVDNFIETYRRYFDIPGVSIALVKDGKLAYHKTYGVKNTFTGERVDSNTLFEAASITKPVFAFAVEKLAERNVIDLDKPLYEYLPYKDIEYDERYKLITARHVLTHRTGFPNWRSMNPDGKLNLRFTPGTGYNYSGEGFEYLKMVVEKITGKKVEQVLQEEVIEPIGLYHTFFSKNDSLQAMVANGHFNMLPSSAELPESPGMAYSMHTEAKIFTKFMIYLLEQKGLNEQSYNTILSKHSDYNYDPGDKKPKVPTYMGMSLEIRETPYGKTFGHGGNNGDFKCNFEVYKDLKMGYVVFTNSNTSDPLIHYLREFLIDGKQD
jgi:CubicO group peptidase (beta-lactamase class C family)